MDSVMARCRHTILNSSNENKPQHREIRRLKYIIGIASVVFGILIIVYAALFSGPYREDQIMRISGVFNEYVENSSWVPETDTTRYIRLQDGSRYTIDSITYEAFDKDSLLSNVKTGDSIELIVEKDNRIRPSVLAIYKEGQEYMDYEKAQNERQKNQMTGYVLGAVFFILGLIVLMIPMKQFIKGMVPPKNGHPQNATHFKSAKKKIRVRTYFKN